MTIGADGGFLRAVPYRAPVNAVLVGDERLRGLAIRLHKKFLTVTPSARRGNIGVTDWRLGIVTGNNLMDITVAVLAARRRVLTRLAGSGMGAVGVGLLRVSMALCAGYFLDRKSVV